FTGNEEELAAAASTAFNRVAGAVDRRMAELKGCREALSEEVAGALRDPQGATLAGVSQGQEIRNYVRALKPSERRSFLVSAASSGDVRTVSAVMAAPPFLSGLSADDVVGLRKHAALALAPVQSS